MAGVPPSVPPMPQIKVPRLYLNRCGVFCFRLKTATEDRRFSLGTKCPHTANIMALQLNAENCAVVPVVWTAIGVE